MLMCYQPQREREERGGAWPIAAIIKYKNHSTKKEDNQHIKIKSNDSPSQLKNNKSCEILKLDALQQMPNHQPLY
jgi:hypothetical protein